MSLLYSKNFLFFFFLLEEDEFNLKKLGSGFLSFSFWTLYFPDKHEVTFILFLFMVYFTVTVLLMGASELIWLMCLK